MDILVPRVARFTYERPSGLPSKDPINVAFVDMLNGMITVRQIFQGLGFTGKILASDQYFAEPDQQATTRSKQDHNIATEFLGLNGRDHVRIYEVRSPGGANTVVGAIHEEDWPLGKHGFRWPCDAVLSFDAPRMRVMEAAQKAGFRTTLEWFGNANPLYQCSKTWPKSDGKILIVREPQT